MATSRPFAYNPSYLNLPGTYNIGTMCVGVGPELYINNYYGLTWWNGPDEELGYCIGTVVPAQNKSTPLGNIGNVTFWRTSVFTDLAFLNLVKEVTGKSFANTPTACAYLESNNYWTSYNDLTIYYFVISNRITNTNYRDDGRRRIRVMANSTPAYYLYQKLSRERTNVNYYTLLEFDDVGSPSKISNGGCRSEPHQYTYNTGYWLTDVTVYQKNGVAAFGFPTPTFTYGPKFYKSIVIPYLK